MRLAVAAVASMAVIVAAVLSIGPAPTPAKPVAVVTSPVRISPGAVVKKHLRHLGVPSDSLSPPGCLRIVGQAAPASCMPCPPLWLGGPTVQCISVWTTAVSKPNPIRIGFCPVRTRYALISSCGDSSWSYSR